MGCAVIKEEVIATSMMSCAGFRPLERSLKSRIIQLTAGGEGESTYLLCKCKLTTDFPQEGGPNVGGPPS